MVDEVGLARRQSTQSACDLPDGCQSRESRRRVRANTGCITEAVINAAKDLNSSYLFIQGPPGTGKTYTAALTMMELLRAGFRVGVSSNSHKAINKALEEIEKHAKTKGFSFVGVKRGSKDDPETAFNGLNITTVYKSEEVTTAHRLVGGTVFHFSRDDQRKAFDYLFVDEAGQVSLGNLVAMGGARATSCLSAIKCSCPNPCKAFIPVRAACRRWSIFSRIARRFRRITAFCLTRPVGFIRGSAISYRRPYTTIG